jgi:hypothetical protein
VFAGDVICLAFFQGAYPERRGFQIYYTNLLIFTIKFLPSYIACHDSLDHLFQTLKIWIQGLGAAGHVSSATC